MRIHGPSQSKFNVYNKQQQNQIEHKKGIKQEDQLEISSAAKKLQESEQQQIKRSSYVDGIKKAVESGEYKINYEQTAKEMIDYWSK